MAPRRVAELLFRRDMVGPSLANIAASMTLLLLAEKLVLDFVVPKWASTVESFISTNGLFPFLMASGAVLFTIFYWGVGFILALPPLLGVAQQWKIQQGKALSGRALLASLPMVFLNYILGTVLVPLGFYLLLPEKAFDFRALPSTRTLVRDVAVWMVVQEVAFFYCHRWLHEDKRVYAAVHKMHHTWTAPVSLVAIYCHPFEHVLNNLAPLALGPILCGSHVASIGIFIALGLVHTLAVHSGYWLCDDNGMHDEHHAKFNVNYGVFGVMDAWYGTYQLPAGAVATDTKSS